MAGADRLADRLVAQGPAEAAAGRMLRFSGHKNARCFLALTRSRWNPRSVGATGKSSNVGHKVSLFEAAPWPSPGLDPGIEAAIHAPRRLQLRPPRATGLPLRGFFVRHFDAARRGWPGRAHGCPGTAMTSPASK